MAHELSLMFKDWVKKVPEILGLYKKLKRITIWIKSYGNILMIFKANVALNWPNDKRHWTILPYMPGDTGMATTYKLVHTHQQSALRSSMVHRKQRVSTPGRVHFCQLKRS